MVAFSFTIKGIAMMFKEIEEKWRGCETREMRRDLCEKLFGTERGWWRACQIAVERDDVTTLEEWLRPSGTAEKFFNFLSAEDSHTDRDDCRTARAHLLCAKVVILARRTLEKPETLDALLSAAWEAVKEANGDLDVPALFDDVRQQIKQALNHWFTFSADAVFHQIAQTCKVPVAWARDLTAELLGTKRTVDEQAEQFNQVSLPVLLYDEWAQTGATASLVLEKLSDGAGELYPDPARMAFVPLDTTFRQSAENAQQYTRQTTGDWLDNSDVRWRLERPLPDWDAYSKESRWISVALSALLSRPMENSSPLGSCLINSALLSKLILPRSSSPTTRTLRAWIEILGSGKRKRRVLLSCEKGSYEIDRGRYTVQLRRYFIEIFPPP
jgi:hypothetical protein